MSSTVRWYLLFAGVIVLSVLPLLFPEEDEHQQVRARFRALLEEVTVTEQNPPLERLFQAKQAADFFAEQFLGEVISEDGEEHEERAFYREDIKEHLIALYRISREIHPELLSEQYSTEQAGVVVSGRVRIYGDQPHRTGKEETFLEELSFRLLAKKIRGEWLFESGSVERIQRSW